MKRNIWLEIGDEKKSERKLVTALRRVEKGVTPEKLVERIYFKDLKTLLRHLTSRRMEALSWRLSRLFVELTPVSS